MKVENPGVYSEYLAGTKMFYMIWKEIEKWVPTQCLTFQLLTTLGDRNSAKRSGEGEREEMEKDSCFFFFSLLHK